MKKNTRVQKLMSVILATAAALVITAVAAQSTAGSVTGEAKTQIDQALRVAKVQVQGGLENQVQVNEAGTFFSTNSHIVAGNAIAIQIGLQNHADKEAKANLRIDYPPYFTVTAAIPAVGGNVTNITQLDANNWELTIRPSTEAKGDGLDLTIGVATPITMGKGTAELAVAITPVGQPAIAK